MALRIGIDFDNTIIDYNNIFYKLARQYQFIDIDVVASKSEVKAAIIAKYGNDNNWQLLQSKAYGESIYQAECFIQCKAVLLKLVQQGHQLFIVSHKSELSHFDPLVSLRKHALAWLIQQEIISDDFIKSSHLFFMGTLEDKVKKIASLELDIFIDDLDQVFLHEQFPNKTVNIAFGRQINSLISHRIESWNECYQLCELVEKIDGSALLMWLNIASRYPVSAEQLCRDGNNQIIKITDEDGKPFLLKRYFQSESDNRNRAKTEFTALSFLNENNIKSIPKAYYYDDNNQIAFYEYIEHQQVLSIENSRISATAIAQFIIELQRLYLQENITYKEETTDSRTCLNDYFVKIEDRLKQINNGIQQQSGFEEISDFIEHSLKPFKQKIFRASHEKIKQYALDEFALFPAETRTLSPSDLGPHNMLVSQHGCIFIDFEYFGIDDPAKMLSDLFHHAQNKITLEDKWSIFEQYMMHSSCANVIEQRFNIVVDLIGLEWLLIILNVAAPGVIARRVFANPNLHVEGLVKERLDLAKKLLVKYQNISSLNGRYMTLNDNIDSVIVEKLVNEP